MTDKAPVTVTAEEIAIRGSGWHSASGGFAEIIVGDRTYTREEMLAALSQHGGGRDEAKETIRDALMDSQWLAGVTAGWNAAQSDDPNAALAALQKSREGHLAGYAEAKAILAAPITPPDAEAVERVALQRVADEAVDWYVKRNGHRSGIQDDSGEKCWIVPDDVICDVRASLAKPAPEIEGREEIARIIARELMRQDDDDPVEQPASWDLRWPWLDQGGVDFGQIADAILPALPATNAGVEEAVAAERERCAKRAEDIGAAYGEDETGWFECSETIAAAIRAPGAGS